MVTSRRFRHGWGLAVFPIAQLTVFAGSSELWWEEQSAGDQKHAQSVVVAVAISARTIRRYSSTIGVDGLGAAVVGAVGGKAAKGTAHASVVASCQVRVGARVHDLSAGTASSSGYLGTVCRRTHFQPAPIPRRGRSALG